MSRLRALPGVLLPAALLLAACSSSVSLDMDKLEEEITKTATTAFPGRTVANATCPESDTVDVETGGTFECTVEVDGATAVFTVTQTDDEGNVNYEPKTALIDTALAAEEAAAGIEEQLDVTATVDCGSAPVLALEPTETFECTATADDGSSAVVVFTVEDAEGNVSWELQDG